MAKSSERKISVIANRREDFPFGEVFKLSHDLPEKKCFTDIKGAVAWGGAKGEEWFALFNKGENEKWASLLSEEELPLDTTISTNQIVLRIRMYPEQVFEINPLKENVGNIEKRGGFLGSLKNFVVGKGYELKVRPKTKYLPAPTIDEIEITDYFEALIDEIENHIAFVTLIDNNGGESYMEIPCEDLQKNKIECKSGILFSLTFKQRGEWEAIRFEPIKRPAMTEAELDDLTKYYEDKYRDV